MSQSKASRTGHKDATVQLERRVARLERLNRLLALALVGALGVGAGAVMFGARAGSAESQQGSGDANGGERIACKPVSVVLDPSRGSGRWSSSLLAVDADGQVFVLDTTRPQTFWRRFEFSP